MEGQSRERNPSVGTDIVEALVAVGSMVVVVVVVRVRVLVT